MCVLQFRPDWQMRMNKKRVLNGQVGPKEVYTWLQAVDVHSSDGSYYGPSSGSVQLVVVAVVLLLLCCCFTSTVTNHGHVGAVT